MNNGFVHLICDLGKHWVVIDFTRKMSLLCLDAGKYFLVGESWPSRFLQRQEHQDLWLRRAEQVSMKHELPDRQANETAKLGDLSYTITTGLIASPTISNHLLKAHPVCVINAETVKIRPLLRHTNVGLIVNALIFFPILNIAILFSHASPNAPYCS